MNPTALITGASSGIGYEIAKQLAARGYNLVLTARQPEKLEKARENIAAISNQLVASVTADLHDSEAPQKIYDFCKANQYSINLLVNNAGYALAGAFHETTMEDEEQFLRVLGISVIALTKLILKDMLVQGEGRIMFISSVAAYAPPSSIQVLYGPVKTFINRFNEALNLNYNTRGIYATAVCPGYTVTNFHTASGVQKEMDRVPLFMKKNAARVAKEAVEATLKRKKVSVPTKTFKIIVFLLQVLPKGLFPFFSKRLAPGRYKN